MYQSLTPNLMVTDMVRSISFYSETLGMTFRGGVVLGSHEYVSEWPCDSTLGFAMFSDGDMNLMLQSRESMAEDMPILAERAIASSAFLYFKVDAVDTLYERVSGKLPILLEPRETFYGMREFVGEDPDGYVLVFAQPLQKN